MLGEDGGEGWRHVLDDEDRRLVDHSIELGDYGIESLWPASRGTDEKNARLNGRERTQLDGILISFIDWRVLNAPGRRQRLVRRHQGGRHRGRGRGLARLRWRT